MFLNLFANGFYAVGRRTREKSDPAFEPRVKAATRDLGDAVEARVWDNGVGIPLEITDKLFQPFFTTKPTGDGAGLGLSIATKSSSGNTAALYGGQPRRRILRIHRAPAAAQERLSQCQRASDRAEYRPDGEGGTRGPFGRPSSPRRRTATKGAPLR